jgi:hypothetical protein
LNLDTYHIPLISDTLSNPLVLCNQLLPRPFRLQDLPPQNALSFPSVTYPGFDPNVGNPPQARSNMGIDSPSVESTTTTTTFFFPQQSALSSYKCSSIPPSSSVPNDDYTISLYKSPLSKNEHRAVFLCILTSNQTHPLLSSKTQARLSTIRIDTEPAVAASFGCIFVRKRTRAARGMG